jgi:hypothetical protein
MKTGGLLFLHAPFGADPDRPMHVVHDDPLAGRMRPLGFHWCEDLEKQFPSWMWSPRVYQSFHVNRLDRLGYNLLDVWMPGALTSTLARAYRHIRLNRRPGAERDAEREPSM